LAYTAYVGVTEDAVLNKLSSFALEPILLRTTTDLIERLAYPCLLVDAQQRIVAANTACGELFGLVPAQMAGLPVFAVADALFDRPQLRALANGRGPWTEVQDLELDLEVANLGRRIVSVAIVRIQTGWLDVGVTLLAFQDNTQRTLLSEERAALATAIDQAANVIAVTNARGALTYANPAFARLAGKASTQLVGSDALEVFGGLLAPIRSDDVACLLCADGWSGPCTAVGTSGTTRLLDVVSAPVKAGRVKLQGHVIVGLDVTRERRVEEELRREVADRAAVARSLS